MASPGDAAGAPGLRGWRTVAAPPGSAREQGEGMGTVLSVALDRLEHPQASPALKDK